MEKTQLNIDLLLPEVPDERDACVQRIIKTLEQKNGIGQVHLVTQNDGQKARLCFHYNPSVISVSRVQQLAREAGAALTGEYGHLLLEVTGVRHPRHARILEDELRDLPGLQTVSVSATNFIRLEFNKSRTSVPSIVQAVQKRGLQVKSIEDFHHPGQAFLTPHPPQKAGEQAHEAHAHGGEKTELHFALLCGGFLAAGFALSFIVSVPGTISYLLYAAAYFFGGFYTTKEAIAGISKGDFDIDFLMLVAAVGAAALGQWAEGALLLFLFSLGHSLEHYAMAKAKKSIAALAGLAPKTALLKTKEGLQEVPIEKLHVGNRIVIKPHSKIPADGLVAAGSSSVNQAPITGESIPADKVPLTEGAIDPAAAEKTDARHRVYAGSINGSGNLEVVVSKLAADSTIARLVKLVNEAQTQKSPTQHFTNRIERYYVPAILIFVGLLLFAFLVLDEPFSASFYRAMAVLVAASPCALAISTPSAVLSGVARAARSGLLVKGGKPLEDLGSLTAMAFDKTGTLTEGKPRLTGVYPLGGINETELLEKVVAVEKLSDHPLAAAVVKGGVEKLGRDVPPATQLEAIQGRGIKAKYRGTEVYVGNKELFIEKDAAVLSDVLARAGELEAQGNTTMLVQQNGIFTGLITLMDVARPEAQQTLQALAKSGIRKMIMLTGDNQKVANAIAREIGLTEALGNLLPEQKVAAIEKLKASEKKIAMVGDGVNDAPAMAKSTVGIAMGAAGSDVALETADIALMGDNLSHLPFAIGLSRQARRIIKQNLFISLGMVAVLLPLTLSGLAKIGPAVIGHEGSTLVVVFNALRLLVYKGEQTAA